MLKLNKSVPEINIFLSIVSTDIHRNSTEVLFYQIMNNSKLTEC